MKNGVVESELKFLQLEADPFLSFSTWFLAAKNAGQVEPEAMSLASCSLDGKPSLRLVLMRKSTEDGFYFFTNYTSRKSLELFSNPKVALAFHWRSPLHRQIRIEGSIEKASAEISDEYYYSRARGSQISAWASPQSQPVPDRPFLESRHEQVEHRFESEKLVRPEFWGGIKIIPSRFEFWQEREFRFHDRIVYDWREGVPSTTGSQSLLSSSSLLGESGLSSAFGVSSANVVTFEDGFWQTSRLGP